LEYSRITPFWADFGLSCSAEADALSVVAAFGAVCQLHIYKL
jgi:hypothetical protein